MTLNRLAALHNEMMGKILEPGTMKNYKSKAIYLWNYLNLKYDAGDIYLKDLTYQFITGFEWYIRNNPIKDKDPFMAYKLRFKRHEMEFLDKDELARIEGRELENPMLRQVRDLFIFSCYTGLAYIDLVTLKPTNIMAGADGMQWIRTSRKKTEIPVNVPLLRPALAILEKFRASEDASRWETLFPKVSNQEMNRFLKLIAEICEIKKRLTFHLARYTFATTITLLSRAPIETISKLLGHTKLATTMIYRVPISKRYLGDLSII